MKKGFLRLIFSRFLIILSLLLLQVGIGLGFFWWITEYVPYLHIFRVLFTAAMVIYLFNNSMDSTAKLTWMFLIALMPIPGAAFLLFTQTDIGHRVLKRRVEELIAETKSLLVQPEGVREELEQDGSGTDDIGTYLKLSGSFPIYRNAETVYFPEGEDAFAALLEELRKAEHYIFLEFFLIEEGYMWSEVLKILIEKAQAGVDVRVLYDGLSEFFTLPKNYYRLLEQHGIKAKAFAPIYPFVSSRYNYRDHRKIVVIDGKTAFTGGFNLADEYINRIVRFGHWKDTSVLIRGSAVKSFTLMFLQMWAVDEEGEKKSDFLPADVTVFSIKQSHFRSFLPVLSDFPLLQKILQALAPAGMAELPQGFRFNLADSFTGYVEFPSDFFQRSRLSVIQAVPQAEHLCFPRGQGIQHIHQLFLQ